MDDLDCDTSRWCLAISCLAMTDRPANCEGLRSIQDGPPRSDTDAYRAPTRGQLASLCVRMCMCTGARMFAFKSHGKCRQLFFCYSSPDTTAEALALSGSVTSINITHAWVRTHAHVHVYIQGTSISPQTNFVSIVKELIPLTFNVAKMCMSMREGRRACCIGITLRHLFSNVEIFLRKFARDITLIRELALTLRALDDSARDIAKRESDGRASFYRRRNSDQKIRRDRSASII